MTVGFPLCLGVAVHERLIHVEDARVLACDAAPEGQFIVRLEAPACARDAAPGQFVHLRCDASLPMRRPYSILSVDRGAGVVEILFSVTGVGGRLLSGKVRGDVLSCMGPIGRPFALSSGRDTALLLGGGVGMPPILFFAGSLAPAGVFVVVASERPFPFETRAAAAAAPGLPDAVNLNLARLEDIGVNGRLASARGYDGCYRGFAHEAAALWLDAKSPDARARVEVFGCGPPRMLEACAAMAAEYDLPCRLAFEEHMACAVGGCAGCAIAVHRKGRRMMKRVCVDGPVFDAAEVYPGAFPS